MIKHISLRLPAPFHGMDCVVIERIDGEDDDNLYYRSDLFMEDRNSETGLRLLMTGARRALPKSIASKT